MKKYVNSEDGDGGGDDKVIVLISSLMAWDATPRKLEALIEPGTEPVEPKVEEEVEEKEKGSQEGEESEKAESEKQESEKAESVVDENAVEGEKKEPEPESSEVETVIVEKKKIKRKYLNHAFAEADYKDRQASEQYKIIKEVEDLVLEAQRPGIRTYVISAGVLYGKGEAIFNSHFKKAWL